MSKRISGIFDATKHKSIGEFDGEVTAAPSNNTSSRLSQDTLSFQGGQEKLV
jgi:hypothetical protein